MTPQRKYVVVCTNLPHDEEYLYGSLLGNRKLHDTIASAREELAELRDRVNETRDDKTVWTDGLPEYVIEEHNPDLLAHAGAQIEPEGR